SQAGVAPGKLIALVKQSASDEVREYASDENGGVVRHHRSGRVGIFDGRVNVGRIGLFQRKIRSRCGPDRPGERRVPPTDRLVQRANGQLGIEERFGVTLKQIIVWRYRRELSKLLHCAGKFLAVADARVAYREQGASCHAVGHEPRGLLKMLN